MTKLNWKVRCPGTTFEFWEARAARTVVAATGQAIK